jgi:hypothetical protein
MADSSSTNAVPSLTPGRLVVIWWLLFFIGAGLGYPTLNRFDPGKSGLVDVATYRILVENGPRDALGRGKYRLLVPTLAKPFYLLAKGHSGSWDPALFGLLVANASLVGASATLLLWLGLRLTGKASAALGGAALYLLNFAVPNGHLAGLVDSGEGFALILAICGLHVRRWWVLPVAAALGGLGKETAVPLVAALAVGWICVDSRSYARRDWVCALTCTGLGLVLGLGTVTVIHSIVDGRFVGPWSMASEARHGGGLVRGLLGCLRDQSFWYIFLWLLPLGLVRLSQLDRRVVIGSAVSALAALGLGAYHHAGGNVARSMFNAVGPVLSLSAALLLTNWLEMVKPEGPRRPWGETWPGRA